MEREFKNEENLLGLTAILWNEYIKAGFQHPDEQNELRSAIHRIQDLIAVRIARSVRPDLYPIK